VDKTAKVVARFEPKVRPESPEVTAAIEKAAAVGAGHARPLRIQSFAPHQAQ